MKIFNIIYVTSIAENYDVTFIKYLQTQQTPKLLAQAPAVIPPFCWQS